jgi:hypothetical protein
MKRVKPTTDRAVPHWKIPILEHLGRYPISAQFAVKWINNGGLPWPACDWFETGKSNGYYRITDLIGAFHDAAHDLSTPEKALLYSSTDPVIRKSGQRPAPLSRINRILEHYVLQPYCPRIDADLRHWHVRWVPTRRGRSSRPVTTARAVTPEETGELYAGEIEVLQQVLTMASESTLDYLAVCRCGRWYVRRRLDQKFCSAECRAEFRRSSDSWKEHRRKYMNRYNRLKRSGNVK